LASFWNAFAEAQRSRVAKNRHAALETPESASNLIASGKRN
jgi:hypothetical protein